MNLNFRWMVTVALILTVLPVQGLGQQQPVPAEIKDTVVFLFPTDEISAGTGFFVSVEGQPKRVYLVTAKHVLMSTPRNYYSSICMKVNYREGSSRIRKAKGTCRGWNGRDTDASLFQSILVYIGSGSS